MPSFRPPRAVRPALWLLLGLVGVDALVALGRDRWDRHSPDDYSERVNGCRAVPRDLVIVGGSPVSEGLDPAAFDGLPWRGQPITAGYSLGLPGGTMTDFLFAIRAGTASHPPPRLVIYGAAPTDLNDARNEPHGPYSVWAWSDWADVWATRPDAREWATRRFLEGRLRRGWALWRYRHGVRTAAAVALDDAVPGAGGPTALEGRTGLAYSQALRGGRGYAPAKHYADTSYAESKRANKPPAPFDFLDKYRAGSHAKYLDKLADWCDAAGADLVVVSMPVTADLDARYPAQVSEGRRVLRAFADRRGVPVLDASRAAVGLGDDDFADVIHLNRGGCAKLSAWVRARVSGVSRP